MAQQHPYDLPYHWCMSTFHKYVVEEGVRRIAPIIRGRFVLDVGCGDGFVSALMSSHARWVHGVDLNERAIRFAEMIVTADNVSFAVDVAGSVQSAARKVETVEVITAFEVIEHLASRERTNFLEGAREVLSNSEGWLVLTTPNGRRARRNNVFHEEELTAAQLVDLLDSHGFAEISVEGLYLRPPLDQLEHLANFAPFRGAFRALGRAGGNNPDWSRTLVCTARAQVN